MTWTCPQCGNRTFNHILFCTACGEPRRQAQFDEGDRLQGWNAAIEAGYDVCHNMSGDAACIGEPDEHVASDKLFDAAEKIRKLQPPSSWPVSPLVAENARLRDLLKRWCQCPEITEVGGEDLDEETDKVWRLTRAALANHEPRE